MDGVNVSYKIRGCNHKSLAMTQPAKFLDVLQRGYHLVNKGSSVVNSVNSSGMID